MPHEPSPPLEMCDLVVRLERGIKSLAACARALAAADINIDAVQCERFDAPVDCNLLVADGEAAVSALQRAGIGAVRCTPVLVYTLPNQPGTLARYAQALVDRGVDVNFVYQATGKGVVVGAPDLDALREAFAGVGAGMLRTGGRSA